MIGSAKPARFAAAAKTPGAAKTTNGAPSVRSRQAASASSGPIPAGSPIVIASGGAGTLAHFPPAIAAGADAVLAASVFHFGALRIGEVKQTLRAAGHPVR